MLSSAKRVLFAALLTIFGLMAGSAQAAATLPPEVTQAFTDQKDLWALMSPLIWGLLTLVAGGFYLMGLFKKGLSKSK